MIFWELITLTDIVKRVISFVSFGKRRERRISSQVMNSMIEDRFCYFKARIWIRLIAYNRRIWAIDIVVCYNLKKIYNSILVSQSLHRSVGRFRKTAERGTWLLADHLIKCYLADVFFAQVFNSVILHYWLQLFVSLLNEFSTRWQKVRPFNAVINNVVPFGIFETLINLNQLKWAKTDRDKPRSSQWTLSMPVVCNV